MRETYAADLLSPAFADFWAGSLPPTSTTLFWASSWAPAAVFEIRSSSACQPFMVPSPTLPCTGRSMLDMNNGGTRTRSTWRLAGLILVLVTALAAQAEPPSSTIPGRKARLQ
jgi:hypothetical protein